MHYNHLVVFFRVFIFNTASILHLNLKHTRDTIASLGTITSLAIIGSLVFLRVCLHPHLWGLYSGGSRYTSYWRYTAVGFLHLEAGQPTAYLPGDYMSSATWAAGFPSTFLVSYSRHTQVLEHSSGNFPYIELAKPQASLFAGQWANLYCGIVGVTRFVSKPLHCYPHTSQTIWHDNWAWFCSIVWKLEVDSREF